MNKRTLWGLLTAVLLLIALGISFRGIIGSNGQALARAAMPAPAKPQEQKDGLKFRLSEGSEVPTTRPEALKVAPGTPLSDAEVDELLKRLPELKKPEVKEFAFRDRSLPPPRPGKTIAIAFPPLDQKSGPAVPVPPVKPLEILRHSPDGHVSTAPAVSVAFSQAMVPITTQEKLAELPVPVSIQPQAAGQWRWLGTRNAVFVPEAKRFAGSTKYTVEVPAGTVSAEKGKLANAFRWQFTTATLTLKSHLPGNEPQPLKPVIYMEFDQKIKRDYLLKTITVKASNQAYQFRESTAAELEAHKDIESKIKKLPADTYLVLVPTQELPARQTFLVTIPAGTTSAEGPLPTPAPQVFTFSTYGPLKIVRSESTTGESSPVTPGESWYIKFTNSLDQKKFKPDLVRVEPAIPNVKVACHGYHVFIHGQSVGRTTYKVTFSDQTTDVFGQHLQPPLSTTVKVGAAEPQLGYLQPLVVLLPDAPRSLPIHSINLSSVKMEIYSVKPEDYGPYINDQEKGMIGRGKQLYSGPLTIASKPDAWVTTWLDLKPYLKHGLGNVVVRLHGRRYNYDYSESCWIQSTQIGVTAVKDSTRVLGWASSLKDGKPLSGVRLKVYPGDSPAADTAQDGLAMVSLPAPEVGNPGMLIARKGDDAAFVISSQWATWRSQINKPQLVWYTMTDRSPYRPSEEVRVKGWERVLTPGTAGDITWSSTTSTSIRYNIQDSQGAELGKGEAPVDRFGGFDFKFKIPDSANTGSATISLEDTKQSGMVSNTTSMSFQIQEFRRPEFEMSVKKEDDTVPMIGKHVTLSANAKYYTGGPLANAQLDWSATATPGSYTPAGWSEYTFGECPEIFYCFGMPRTTPQESKTMKSATDAAGKHLLRVDFDSVDPPQPMSLRVEGTVHDVNRQTWSDSTTLLVHPSELYVGLKTESSFIESKVPYKFDLIVTNLDGKAVKGVDVSLHLAKQEGSAPMEGEFSKVKESNVQDKTVQSQEKPLSLSLSPSTGGYYKLTATIADSAGRKNHTIVNVWVQGEDSQPDTHTLSGIKAQLLPDKKEYAPGETAKLMVVSPVVPAHGLLVLSRSGIVSKREFVAESSTTTLEVPIEEAYLPNLHAQVHLVGMKKTSGAKGADVLAPAHADADANLSISTESRHLSITVKPKDKELDPGAQASVEIEITDSKGHRVPGASVVLGVVDEALLSLSGYKYPEAMTTFYREHETDTELCESRSSVLLDAEIQGRNSATMYDEAAPGSAPLLQGATNGSIGPQSADASMMSISGGGGAGGAIPAVPSPAPRARSGFMREMKAKGEAMEFEAMAPPPPPDEQKAIQMRSNFDALAYFTPSVVSDGNGVATVSFKLPDNLTRYRVMAVVATDSKQFGNGDCSITARLPLMVRPSAPRFLNFGDKFELPVVLQNQTDKEMEVRVAVRSDNLALSGVRGKKVSVPANDRIEVRFPASTSAAGTASYQVVAASQTGGDASEGKLPIWTPATTEAFATYGEIDDGAILQPIASPTGVFTQFGGVQITTSSTALNALADAFMYLKTYPFECSEQVSSRLLAVAALKDMVAAFNPEGLGSAGQVNECVKKDIDILASRQGYDGGFGLWERGKDEFPFVAIHVMHALAVAKQKDFAVQDEVVRRGNEYLKYIERHIPSTYSQACRRSIIAYALYVRSLTGDIDTAKAHSLLHQAKLESNSFETLGWLLSVLSHGKAADQADANAIATYFNNQANETAGTAQFGSSADSLYGEDGYLLLHSGRREDAVVLDSLISYQPKNPLIPKVVSGLLAHRKKGRWDNTQENAFILLALDRYFHTYEKAVPNFVAQVWLGNLFAGDQKFVGRSTERKNIDVPMQYLADKQEEQKLVINKEGKGRLYYRIGMQYAPKDLTLKPFERGFQVERKYEAVENPDDVKKNTDGTWQVKAGSLVRVRLKMVAPGRRYHVALVDPLPAGFEPVNPDLQGSQKIEDKDKKDAPTHWWSWCFWWRPVWYEHQNLRDERAEAFTSLLWDGTYEYTYNARATTPGEFIVPPTKAEEMYAPETFGRTGTDRVTVQ